VYHSIKAAAWGSFLTGIQSSPYISLYTKIASQIISRSDALRNVRFLDANNDEVAGFWQNGSIAWANASAWLKICLEESPRRLRCVSLQEKRKSRRPGEEARSCQPYEAE
jgi:hypothetical protein